MLMVAASASAKQTEFAYFVAALFAFVMYQFVQNKRDRARAGDHVVETSRDVAIPDHCVSCGAPHATTVLEVPAWFLNQSNLAWLLGRHLRVTYPFRFCHACAIPIIRRRRIGRAIVGVAFAMWASFPITLLICYMLHDYKKGMMFFTLFIVELLGGEFVLIAGLVVKRRAASSVVSILDTRGDNVLYTFRNQIYRNHFAELNGEA